MLRRNLTHGFAEAELGSIQRRCRTAAAAIIGGVSDEIAAIDGLTGEMLVTLGEAEVKTLDDLGDLAGDELIETLPDAGFSEEEANAIIMAARAHWFDDEPTPEGEAAAAAEATAETDTAKE